MKLRILSSEKLRRWSSSSIILRSWVTGTPPVTHIYIKSSSNQRSTTSRVASAAGRLRPNALVLTGLATWPSVPYERPDTCEIGGSDGTRTRDLLRDRQAF